MCAWDSIGYVYLIQAYLTSTWLHFKAHIISFRTHYIYICTSWSSRFHAVDLKYNPILNVITSSHIPRDYTIIYNSYVFRTHWSYMVYDLKPEPEATSFEIAMHKPNSNWSFYRKYQSVWAPKTDRFPPSLCVFFYS